MIYLFKNRYAKKYFICDSKSGAVTQWSNSKPEALQRYMKDYTNNILNNTNHSAYIAVNKTAVKPGDTIYESDRLICVEVFLKEDYPEYFI